MRRSLTMAIAVAMALPSAAFSQAQRGGVDAPVYSKPTEFAAAEAQARATLPVFWAKFEAKAEGYSQFGVKALFRTDDGHGEEALWVTVHSRAPGERVRGFIANEPVAIKDLHRGSPVEFDAAHIVDWQYVKNGRAYGHFRTRAMMARANAAQRAEAMADLAPTPLESDKP